MKEDFNLLFWRVFGVNQRVYELEDVFKVKRDKQSDEKNYSHFLKSDDKLSNENYLQQSVREIEIFDVLFIDYLLGYSSVNEFYIHQLKNIMFNYKMFKSMYVEEKIYINMFSFQIAFIMEKMYINSIDTSLFDKSLEENSMEPFISKCKSKTQCKTNEALSVELSYASAEMKEKVKNNNKDKFDVISPKTFKKDLSKWKNKREVPAFMKLLVIMNIIKQPNKHEQIGIFIQLIIIRALLHIQKEFKINDDVKNQFIQQLKSFRREIRESDLKNNENNIMKQQENYLINFPSYEQKNDDSVSIRIKIEHFYSIFKKFCENNFSNEMITITVPDRESIIERFSKCETEDDYRYLLDDIKDVSSDIQYSQNINTAYSFIRLIISIKIGDKVLFNEKYKYFDRSFGNLLSLFGVEKEMSPFMKILKGKNDLIECIEYMGEYIQKVSTIE